MRIGIQQTALGEASLARCFGRAKRAGAEGIGLCYRTAEEARGLSDPRHVSKLRLLADRFGMAVTGLHLSVLCDEQSLIGPPPLIAQSQELVRRAIAMSAELGGPDVIVPFFRRNRIELPTELSIARSAMSELAETAESHGVVLAVESSLHLGQLQAFLTWCGSEFVRVCLDTGDVTACRHDAVNVILGLGTHNIAQVRLKDVRVVTGLPPDFNVRLGQGNVPFNGVANALQGVGYNGWVLLETPPGDDRGAMAAAHVQYARGLFRVLRAPDDRARGAGTALTTRGGVA